MKEIFEKIEQEAKEKNKVRWPTSVDGVQTIDDVKILLKYILEELKLNKK